MVLGSNVEQSYPGCEGGVKASAYESLDSSSRLQEDCHMSITTTNTTARWYIRWLTALVGALIVTTLSTITTLDSEISALAPSDR